MILVEKEIVTEIVDEGEVVKEIEIDLPYHQLKKKGEEKNVGIEMIKIKKKLRKKKEKERELDPGLLKNQHQGK